MLSPSQDTHKSHTQTHLREYNNHFIYSGNKIVINLKLNCKFSQTEAEISVFCEEVGDVCHEYSTFIHHHFKGFSSFLLSDCFIMMRFLCDIFLRFPIFLHVRPLAITMMKMIRFLSCKRFRHNMLKCRRERTQSEYLSKIEVYKIYILSMSFFFF